MPAVSSVTIEDAFWGPRREVNRTVTLWNQYEKLEDRLDNLRKAAGIVDGDYRGTYHNDPPVYKWIEAANYVLETTDDEEMAKQIRTAIDEIVEILAAAQLNDGYLHSNFILQYDQEDRWTNLHRKHELFAAGHLFEAAVAHAEATGEETLLDVAIRLADHIDERFGPNANDGYPGHQEVELGLVQLYRDTEEQRYLDLAKFFLDERGRGDSRFEWELEHSAEIMDGPNDDLFYDADEEYDGSHVQDNAPVRDQEEAVGHAVRALFQYAGMVDVGIETGDESLVTAAERLWHDVTERKMYLTGGVGARVEGEAFGDAYELPNESAYAETCASFANVMWNRRLLNVSGEGRFADVMERILYNGFLAGASLDGTKFTYTNPLAHDEDEHHRQDWFRTVCCPPNIARLLASLERYVYSVGEEVLYVNLFVGGEIETAVRGKTVNVAQTTDYPWSGEVTIDVSVPEPVTFDLAMRIPGWAREAELRINGDLMDDRRVESGYVHVDRTFKDGDIVELDLAMPVERVKANPNVESDRGRVALQRGPLVYCLEATDNTDSVHRLAIPADPDPTVEFHEELLDGVAVVEGDAVVPTGECWEGSLYRPADDIRDRETSFTAIPYYAWDNREPGPMRVWLIDGGRHKVD
jgi:DUF1680 family protein